MKLHQAVHLKRQQDRCNYMSPRPSLSMPIKAIGHGMVMKSHLSWMGVMRPDTCHRTRHRLRSDRRRRRLGVLACHHNRNRRRKRTTPSHSRLRSVRNRTDNSLTMRSGPRCVYRAPVCAMSHPLLSYLLACSHCAAALSVLMVMRTCLVVFLSCWLCWHALNCADGVSCFLWSCLCFDCFIFSRDPYLLLTAESAQPQREEDCTIQ